MIGTAPDAAAEAQCRIRIAAFGADAERRLAAAGAPLDWLASADAAPDGDLVCAVVDPAAAHRAQAWLRAGTGLTLVLGAEIEADVRLGSVGEASLPVLLSVLDGIERLVARQGAVCVELADVRFTLASAGAIAVASARGPAQSVVEQLLAEFQRQGVSPGQAQRLLVAVLVEDLADVGVLDAVYAALHAWMHPQGIPIVGLREGALRGEVRLEALAALPPAEQEM